MRNQLTFLLLFSFSTAFISCADDPAFSTQKESEEEAPPQKDTAKAPPVEQIPINSKYTFDELLQEILDFSFDSRLFRNLEEAKAFFDDKEIYYDATYSEEEFMTTLWVTLETSDKKNMVEFFYHYQDQDGEYIDFRNIISKIEDQNRSKTVEALKKLAEENTHLEGRKYKKSYGEEGWVYFEEGTGQAMQTIVTEKGGNTDWIEIRRCFYFYVGKEELIE